MPCCWRGCCNGRPDQACRRVNRLCSPPAGRYSYRRMSETLYIIDGHSQIYRAYYAPFRDLTSPAGEPVRATYVFCSMLLKFIQAHRPRYLGMAVDGPAEKLHRRKLYPDYKITRKPMPEDLPVQVDRICRIVETMGIPILRAEGYEADDIMATAAERFASGQLRVVLISRDKDLDQLVNDNVVLYDPMKDQTITAEDIEKTKGYPPAKAVEVQTLMGDATDNIPGVPGVGPKKAADLIARYGSAEEVVLHADQLTAKLKENILANVDTLALSRKLVTLDRNVPIDLSLESLRFSGLPVRTMQKIFRELGFKRLDEQLARIDRSLVRQRQDAPADTDKGPADADTDSAPTDTGSATDLPGPDRRVTTVADIDWSCVNTPAKLDRLVAELDGVKRLAVDTETTAIQPMWAELVGISLSATPGEAAYIPVKGPLGAAVLDIDLVRRKIGPILADSDIEKIGQNLKYDLIVLRNAGFELGGKFFDTMIAAHVLDSTRRSYKLDDLSLELLGHRCVPIEQVIGSGRRQTTIDTVPLDTVGPYAAEDAEVALRLANVLDGRLADEGLAELFDDLEMPLMPVLAQMEYSGVRVDPAVLKKLEVEFSKQSDTIRDQIIALAGREFNVDSPKQLAEVLFDDLALPVVKKTKTGPSTDSSVLGHLATMHELPRMVLEYRKLTKLLNTYLISLGQCIHPKTGRVHTSFRQTATVTGRLSSTNPNLQNIPVRTEQGRLIRSAFVAADGCVLLSADYSQVELRVLAHLCQDPTLIRAFESDQDIHRIVAGEVFDIPPDQVTADQRAKAKTVNFGIVYGQTAFGLGRTLGISRTDAQNFITRYHARFAHIREFLRECIAKAKADGYVETVSRRRRRIFEIDSRNPARRAAAERLAINSVVQGSAADLIKRAMVNIAARIDHENRPSRMLLQIHDELLFDVPTDHVEDDRRMIVEEMTGAIELRVPLKVDIGLGANWMEAK